MSKKIIISLIVAIALCNCVFVFPAAAITQKYQWTGTKGYSVTAIFSYDETKVSEIISEQGNGKTDQLQSLTVTFYNPDGERIREYQNVIDGVAQGNYFQFNFDPKTQQVLNDIDLGGEVAGDIYLKGKSNDSLSLVTVEPSGKEKIIDRN
ncbi:MAG: hypothetical protein Tsb0014_05800 [Pleurocapsa sp.]